jgi:heme-degrading monooxygenase HmoA
VVAAVQPASWRVCTGAEQEAAFEQVWLSRDSHLDKLPGFVEFHLLNGPEGASITDCDPWRLSPRSEDQQKADRFGREWNGFDR